MSKLTLTAKKIYLLLITGNILIVSAAVILVNYFFIVTIRPTFPPRTVHSIIKFVHHLQTQPQANWPQLLKKQRIPWSKITLSESPLYQDNALLNLKPPIIFDLLKQHKQVQLSVFIKEQSWLNFSLNPPRSNHQSLIAALIVCSLILILALLFINYWGVNHLNQPLQILIQSLKYSESQENWLPIPLTGNNDQKMLFAQINLLQAKMSKLLQNRTQMVTAISHDLRTPLTRLKLRLEYFDENPHSVKMLHDINEMEIMIAETLNYFKDTHHEEKMQRFDLVALLQSLCEDAADLEFDVQFSCKEHKLIYFGAVNLLKRAFSNLVNNAISYGKQAYITIEKTATRIEISIEDNGSGLNESEMEQVFLPFYRGETSRSRQTGGTGLGLTIAREIIQHHHGEINLTNRIQGGLKVLIQFPLKETMLEQRAK